MACISNHIYKYELDIEKLNNNNKVKVYNSISFGIILDNMSEIIHFPILYLKIILWPKTIIRCLGYIFYSYEK